MIVLRCRRQDQRRRVLGASSPECGSKSTGAHWCKALVDTLVRCVPCIGEFEDSTEGRKSKVKWMRCHCAKAADEEGILCRSAQAPVARLQASCLSFS